MNAEKIELAILRAAVRHPLVCCWSPKIAKRVVCGNAGFQNEKIRLVMREIMLNNGDWEAVKAAIVKRNSQLRANWHVKLFAWADRVKGGEL